MQESNKCLLCERTIDSPEKLFQRDQQRAADQDVDGDVSQKLEGYTARLDVLLADAFAQSFN